MDSQSSKVKEITVGEDSQGDLHKEGELWLNMRPYEYIRPLYPCAFGKYESARKRQMQVHGASHCELLVCGETLPGTGRPPDPTGPIPRVRSKMGTCQALS